MATRPVFLPLPSKTSRVREIPVDFTWFSGLSVAQKQRSIDSLHASATSRLGVSRILEISSKSRTPAGVALSAFNLALPWIGSRSVPVEVAYQSSKRFAHGGPYLDLLDKPSRDARGDKRLSESGRLLSFRVEGADWPLEPTTAFYDWVYLKALAVNDELAAQLPGYEAFTDIEFNPARSINCQARAAALYVSLARDGLLEQALGSQEAFLAAIQTGKVDRAV